MNTTFQNEPQVRPGFRIYFDFIFNVLTDPALMEAAAPDPTACFNISIVFFIKRKHSDF